MKTGSRCRKIAIYGAGVKGKSINYSFSIDDNCEYEVMCFIDDNHELNGLFVDGVPIYSFDEFLRCFSNTDLSTVVWAINAHNDKGIAKKRIVSEICSAIGISIISVLLPNEVLSNHERNDSKNLYEYILRRDQSNDKVSNVDFSVFSKKKVLVTGAAGSIGSEICRHLITYEVGELIVLDNGETEISALITELQSSLTKSMLYYVHGDIRDEILIDKIFDEYKPHVVFHAAAFKHVPLMENFPYNAIDVNFYGTYVVASAAIKCGVDKFIQVSTDKSVNPTSVMGATKRLAEKLVICLGKNTKTKFTITRFGNVIGSRGSAIPLFYDQIKKGEPISVTHRDMQRYFMTIPEAVHLMFQASLMSVGEEIFIFDMGEPYRIYDIATRMIEYYGLEIGKNASIEIVGLRSGEKMYEELFSDEENYINDSTTKLRIAKCAEINTNTKNLLFDFLESYRTFRFSNDILKEKIKMIIPEYRLKQNG